mgnify:CR=1 FL=1
MEERYEHLERSRDPRDRRLDQWLETGRQLVDGVAGRRPGQRRPGLDLDSVGLAETARDGDLPAGYAIYEDNGSISGDGHHVVARGQCSRSRSPTADTGTDDLDISGLVLGREITGHHCDDIASAVEVEVFRGAVARQCLVVGGHRWKNAAIDFFGFDAGVAGSQGRGDACGCSCACAGVGVGVGSGLGNESRLSLWPAPLEREKNKE